MEEISKVNKRNYLYQLAIGISLGILLCAGCSNNNDFKMTELQNEKNNSDESIRGDINKDVSPGAELTLVDWSDYFKGLNGAAVVYDPSEKNYMIYNEDLAQTQRSPCSTFKIISSLIGLEKGIINPENSVRAWSGEMFWNEEWNRNIDFADAFRTSCVWYFRQVTNDIGKDDIQRELNNLKYGNCDISDWEGRLNTNNNNRALTGFWIESSLKISPKEQTEVMERIFGSNSDYSERTLRELKKVMLESEQNEKDIYIYGKTGTGKCEGVLVDAWFTGFVERPEGNKYFCVYLGQSNNEEASSSVAKEIALQILSDY